MLSRIEQKQKRSLLKASAMLGISRDNNVYNTHEEDYYLDSVNGNVSPGGIEEDTYYQIMANANYKYDFGRRGFWFLDSSATLYSQKYQDETDANLDYASIVISPSYEFSSYILSLPLRCERVRYSDEDCLKAKSIGLKILIPKQQYTAVVNINQKSKSYEQDSQKDKDSHIAQLNINLLKSYKRFSINAGVEVAKEYKDKSSSTATDVDKKIAGINLSVNTSVFTKGSIGLYCNIKKFEYDDEDSFFNSKRSDDYKSIGISYTHEVKKSIFGR
jgi:hypothetical protein